MPELPEVQTVVNHLRPQIKNEKIISCEILWHKTLYSKNQSFLLNTIKQKEIIDVTRLGKYIIIKLNQNYIAFHLRMTGYLNVDNKLSLNKYVRCYFKLSKNKFLIYEDIRKFGGFYYIKNLNLINKKLGIEPLSNSFNEKWFKNKIKNRKRMIKGLLLDQSYVAGLGNIYIDEVLWHSKIHPERLSNTLSSLDIKQLVKNIKDVLTKSINFHGTTIINFKFDSMKTGNYRNELRAYGKENEECSRCSNIISKFKICGRGTYVCTHCQKKSN